MLQRWRRRQGQQQGQRASRQRWMLEGFRVLVSPQQGPVHDEARGGFCLWHQPALWCCVCVRQQFVFVRLAGAALIR